MKSINRKYFFNFADYKYQNLSKKVVNYLNANCISIIRE